MARFFPIRRKGRLRALVISFTGSASISAGYGLTYGNYYGGAS